MSSGPVRDEVAVERRKPKPSGSTSRVPSPKMLSPFFAWFFSRAKMRSCLRRRLAFSISLALAISTSSVTWRFLRSDRCMVAVGEWTLGSADTGDGARTERGEGGDWLAHWRPLLGAAGWDRTVLVVGADPAPG